MNFSAKPNAGLFRPKSQFPGVRYPPGAAPPPVAAIQSHNTRGRTANLPGQYRKPPGRYANGTNPGGEKGLPRRWLRHNCTRSPAKRWDWPCSRARPGAGKWPSRVWFCLRPFRRTGRFCVGQPGLRAVAAPGRAIRRGKKSKTPKVKFSS
jgi:hypothetical protein